MHYLVLWVPSVTPGGGAWKESIWKYDVWSRLKNLQVFIKINEANWMHLLYQCLIKRYRSLVM